MNLNAIADCAQRAASLRDAGADYRGWLQAGAARYRGEVRAWISDAETDPRLKEFLDSFVHRSDKQHAELLDRTLERAKVPEAHAATIWAAYDRCGSDDDKRVFVQNVLSSTQTGGGMHGQRPERRGSDQPVARPRRIERDL